MCGILAVHGLEKPSTDRAHFIALSKRLRHRGPDWSGCYVGKNSILVHERLAIVGVDTGAQPLISEDGKIILAVNGEIYNHIALRATVGPDVKFKTNSDCEVIIPLVSTFFSLLQKCLLNRVSTNNTVRNYADIWMECSHLSSSMSLFHRPALLLRETLSA